MVDRVVRDKILAHFATLPFWKEYWKLAAVAVVGSTASEQSDQFSDLDILVFVPRSDYDTLYRLYEKAIQVGNIQVLNPRALLYHEFPYALISEINGHYQLQTYEEVQDRIAAYDDIFRWFMQIALFSATHPEHMKVCRNKPPAIPKTC